MQSKIETLPHSRIAVTLTVPDETLSEIEEAALTAYATEVNVPGFRPGKAPASVVRERIGDEALKARTLDRALPTLFYRVIQEKDLKPISRPAVVVESMSPLVARFEVDVFPEVKMAKPKKLSKDAADFTAKDEEVENVLSDIQRRFQTFADVERAAKSGDRLEITFKGSLDGQSLPELASEHHPLILGSGSFVPGFEEQLEGVTKGETRVVKVVFPKDYRKVDLREKEVEFTVNVERIEEVTSPPVDDELAIRATGEPDMTKAKLSDRIREDLVQVKRQEADAEIERQVVDSVVAAVTVDLPRSLVDDEISYMVADLGERVQGQGLKFEHYLQLQKTTMDELRTRLTPEAEKRVIARLGLQKLADERTMTVTDEELATALEGVEPKLRKSDRYRETVSSNLRLAKTLEALKKELAS